MADNFNSIYLDTISSIKQLLYICNNSLMELNHTDFSVKQMHHYKILRQGVFHINRMCNMSEYLLTNYDENIEQPMESYDIGNLLESMTQSFATTIAEYLPVKLHCYTKLRGSHSVLLNQRKFENIFLNILHCCIDSDLLSTEHPAKITIYATETKDSIVFHIRDNNAPLSSVITDAAFLNMAPDFAPADEITFRSAAILTLTTAKKAAEELQGKLTYSSLKSGNRFDIYIPKHRKVAADTMRSTVPYIPNRDLYVRIFADIALKHLIKLTENEDACKD